MSIWGKLAGLAGVVAAPFTGGTSLSWVPTALGVGSAVDGALTGGGDDEGGSSMDDVWGADGSFNGDTTISSSDGSGFNWQALMKYGLPALAGGLKSRTEQANFEKMLAQQKLIAQTSQAMDQSKMDPFRGVVAQTSDAGRLEHAMTPPPSYGPAAGSRYSSAVTPRPITLSPAYLLALKNAQSGVLNGQAAMPNMMDPANWGKNGTQDLTTPLAAPPTAGSVAGPGASVGARTMSPTSFLSRYRMGDDDASLEDDWNASAA